MHVNVINNKLSAKRNNFSRLLAHPRTCRRPDGPSVWEQGLAKETFQKLDFAKMERSCCCCLVANSAAFFSFKSQVLMLYYPLNRQDAQTCV